MKNILSYEILKLAGFTSIGYFVEGIILNFFGYIQDKVIYIPFFVLLIMLFVGACFLIFSNMFYRKFFLKGVDK